MQLERGSFPLSEGSFFRVRRHDSLAMAFGPFHHGSISHSIKQNEKAELSMPCPIHALC